MSDNTSSDGKDDQLFPFMQGNEGRDSDSEPSAEVQSTPRRAKQPEVQQNSPEFIYRPPDFYLEKDGIDFGEINYDQFTQLISTQYKNINGDIGESCGSILQTRDSISKKLGRISSVIDEKVKERNKLLENHQQKEKKTVLQIQGHVSQTRSMFKNIWDGSSGFLSNVDDLNRDDQSEIDRHYEEISEIRNDIKDILTESKLAKKTHKQLLSEIQLENSMLYAVSGLKTLSLVYQPRNQGKQELNTEISQYEGTKDPFSTDQHRLNSEEEALYQVVYRKRMQDGNRSYQVRMATGEKVKVREMLWAKY